MDERKLPERKYVLELKLHGDSLEDICDELGHIAFELQVDKADDRQIVSGGNSTAFTLNMRCNKEQTHDNYMKQLNNYIDTKHKVSS